MGQLGFFALKPNQTIFIKKTKPNQTVYELSRHLNQKRLGKSWTQTEPFNKKFKPNHI